MVNTTFIKKGTDPLEYNDSRVPRATFENI